MSTGAEVRPLIYSGPIILCYWSPCIQHILAGSEREGKGRGDVGQVHQTYGVLVIFANLVLYTHGEGPNISNTKQGSIS
jgi:hypothetical protein